MRIVRTLARRPASWAALMLAALAGCGQQGPVADAPLHATQVIARINGSDVSMLQYQLALRKAGVDSPTEMVRQEVVDKLIDRELAVQQALEQQLERRPEVLTQLEEARRDVLARAWAADIAGAAPRPEENEAASYFSDHPELFTRRKIYRLREVALLGTLPQMAEVKTRLAGGEPLTDTLEWLRREEDGFKDQIVIRAAEQLPIESLPRLDGTAEGKAAIFESARGVIVYQVLAAQPAPLSWDAARPIILAYLTKQAGKRAVVAETEHLRRGADISLVRDFAHPRPGATL